MHGVTMALDEIARASAAIRQIGIARSKDHTRFISLRHALDTACERLAHLLASTAPTHDSRTALLELQAGFGRTRAMLTEHQRKWSLAEVICLPDHYERAAMAIYDHLEHFVAQAQALIDRSGLARRPLYGIA